MQIRSRNSLVLSLISLIGFLVSGYFFYQGIIDSSGNIIVERSPIPTPSSKADILGESSLATASADKSYRVSSVVDGDTIEVEIDGQKKKLRYIGINTPETVDPRKGVECFGKEASQENKNLVLGKEVFLDKDISDTDRFGRLLRYVYLKLEDNKKLFVNDYLIRSGYAYAATFPPDVKFKEIFAEAEREAREKQLGLWGKCV